MTELPHTRTRTVHWVATATALAAVVGATAFVQPAAEPAHSTSLTTASVGSAPNATEANYPLDCGKPGAPVDVVDQAATDFDHDGRSETVAVARCDSETGSPPHGIFVLAPTDDPGKAPKVVTTLVPADERMQVKDFRVSEGTVSATLLGYSSSEVPRCCPDRQRDVKWEWKNGQFELIPAPVAGSAQSI
ncbi:hypothetical protein [Streptomyces sp. HNM0574]|uniref:hypothetical protein n=1 Tax=Streptomyces sp. HNM0574 TaxID=2714954 RepID=UPI003216B9C9